MQTPTPLNENEPGQPSTGWLSPGQPSIGWPSIGWLCRFMLIMAAVIQLSRIIQVQAPTGEVPFFSANDRSRWCTIAALSVNGSYEIDELLEIRDPKTRRRTWYTIDLVRHRGADGKQHYYSSKPPLLPTLYSFVYVAVRNITGATLMGNPFVVVPIILVIVNLIPLLAFNWLLLRWFEREELGAWATIVLCVFVAWGTYLTTFVSTLNNHLPAAMAAGLSLWCIDRIALKADLRWRWFALCGLATSFAGANELPALSWIAAAGGILIFVNARRALLGYVPALLPVAIAFFITNYAAHGEWNPAYAHRSIGQKLFEFESDAHTAIEQLPVEEVARKLRSEGINVSNQAKIEAARREGVFEFWDATTELRIALKLENSPVQSTTATASDTMIQTIGVYEWGDWYDYPGSYWTSQRKQGVDRGEPNRGKYIFHCLLGHHGIFSLTPFWFFSVLGVWTVWSRSCVSRLFVDYRLLIVAAIVATSLVSMGFYLARPLEDRNYGGVASGFRWAFWLTPLWIFLAMQALPTLRSWWSQRWVELCLLVSIFSATYAWENPWVHPWLMQLYVVARWTP